MHEKFIYFLYLFSFFDCKIMNVKLKAMITVKILILSTVHIAVCGDSPVHNSPICVKTRKLLFIPCQAFATGGGGYLVKYMYEPFCDIELLL